MTLRFIDNTEIKKIYTVEYTSTSRAIDQTNTKINFNIFTNILGPKPKKAQRNVAVLLQYSLTDHSSHRKRFCIAKEF
jgi:hypothetical protein